MTTLTTIVPNTPEQDNDPVDIFSPEEKDIAGIKVMRFSETSPSFRDLKPVAEAVTRANRLYARLNVFGDEATVFWSGRNKAPTDADMEHVETAWHAAGGKVIRQHYRWKPARVWAVGSCVEGGMA